MHIDAQFCARSNKVLSCKDFSTNPFQFLMLFSSVFFKHPFRFYSFLSLYFFQHYSFFSKDYLTRYFSSHHFLSFQIPVVKPLPSEHTKEHQKLPFPSVVQLKQIVLSKLDPTLPDTDNSIFLHATSLKELFPEEGNPNSFWVHR